jgi:hypothetical protein
LGYSVLILETVLVSDMILGNTSIPMKNYLSRILFCATAFAFSVFKHASAEGDWTSWRGPYGNGVAEAGQTVPVEFSETKHVQWKASVPGRGHSTPIVVGDRIFLTTAREQEETQSVLCYSFTSGETALGTNTR